MAAFLVLFAYKPGRFIAQLPISSIINFPISCFIVKYNDLRVLLFQKAPRWVHIWPWAGVITIARDKYFFHSSRV